MGSHQKILRKNIIQLLFLSLLLFLKKLNIKSPLIQQFHSWTYTQMNYVHSSIILNSQMVETTHMFISGCQDEQNVVYVYNAVLFSLKNQWNSDICYNMDEP